MGSSVVCLNGLLFETRRHRISPIRESLRRNYGTDKIRQNDSISILEDKS